jgi:type VI secretion system protein VasD
MLPAGLAFLLAAGCSSPPPPPEPPPPPGVVELTVTAAEDINPDPSGRPSPAMMRVYQLADATRFQAADFFQLTDNDAAVLGSDPVARVEFAISPGQERSLTLPLKPNAQFIGVTVAFRDIDRAGWRAVADVPPHGTTELNATLERLRISLAKGKS